MKPLIMKSSLTNPPQWYIVTRYTEKRADLVKEFKIGGKVILSEAQLEVLKMRLEERAVPFRKLQTNG